MRIHKWARKWDISKEAIDDLIQLLTSITPTQELLNPPLSESAIQSLVRMEASQHGCRLWRNNTGATYTKDGNFIRYGLANESAMMNAAIKSADLIGIRPVKITAPMVGLTIGQFMSREIKNRQWKYNGSIHEQAQLAWIELINAMGGDACFANNTGTI